MTETLVNRILDLAQMQPDKPAVIFKKDLLTYRELVWTAAGMAERLRELGVRKGDRVCFSAVSRPEMTACYLAVHMISAVAVFLDKNSTIASMAEIYDEADAALILTDKSMKGYEQNRRVLSLRQLYEGSKVSFDRTGEMPHPECTVLCGDSYSKFRISPGAEDLSEILFTSGTTGCPKGVMLSYRAVLNILKNTIEGIGMEKNDILLLPLPLNHSFALRVLRAALYNGETVVLQNGFTFAKEVENNISSFQCNALAAVPASFEVMRSQMRERFQYVLKGMRYIEFGAGSLTPGQRREITSLLPTTAIYNVWGSSETGGVLFCDVSKAVRDERHIAALGWPRPNIEVRILDPDGVPMNTDAAHPGRMSLRGNMLMSGYWKQEELTKEMLHDGWLLTGDLVYRGEDGELFMLGRADDIINVGGEKVSPIEIENTASEYPFIQECVCIGVTDPDGLLGQIPVLMIKPENGYDRDELIRFLSARLERYKLPHEIMQIDSVPRNRMQKIDRRAAASLWENRGAIDLINPVVQTILNRRSIRKFTDRPIDRKILELLVKAGCQAPSGHNLQTWRFTVIQDAERIQELREAAQTAAEQNRVGFYGWENPQALILVSNDRRNPDGCQDASCAAENILLTAASLGLGSVWLNPLMTLRDTEPVRSVLDSYQIPANHIVWSTIALGYPAADSAVLSRREDVVVWL